MASFNIISKDGLKLTLIPYKGWHFVNEDGTCIKDPLTLTAEGSLSIVHECPKHSHGHILYNLLNSEGEKILSKDVRFITYHPEGYYLIKDNNEDELIARGDVRGGFRACDYIEEYNVVFENGNILSTEWFDHIVAFDYQCFVAKKGCRSLLINSSGDVLLDISTNKAYWTESSAYNTEGDKLYKHSNQGQEFIKVLYPLNKPGRYYIGHQEIVISDSGVVEVNDSTSGLIKCTTSPLPKHLNEWSIIHNIGGSEANILTKDGFLLFDGIYSDIEFSIQTCNTGLFYVKENNKWKLINAEETAILDLRFDDVKIIGQNAVVRIGDTFCLIDAFGKILATDYTAVLWADKGIWGVNHLTKDENRHCIDGEE